MVSEWYYILWLVIKISVSLFFENSELNIMKKYAVSEFPEFRLEIHQRYDHRKFINFIWSRNKKI